MKIRKPKKPQGRGRRGEGCVYLRKDSYWYKIPNPRGGKPIFGPCETSDYAAALLVKQRRILELAEAPPSTSTSPTISTLLEDYARYAEREKPRSWRSMRTAIKHLQEGLGSIPAASLTTAHIDDYRTARESLARVCFQTTNRELGYLRAALRQELKRTPPRISSIPHMRTPSEKDCVREGFITRADYQKILLTLPPSLKAIFVCAFHTGARSGELKAIRWEQVNFSKGVIELRPKTTKNSEGRWLPIWGDMELHLRTQRQVRDRDFPACPWVFFWQHDHHARAIPGDLLKDFRWCWEAACSAAGYPDLLFHDLRRSAIKFADQEAGISPSLTMLMSGHKTEAVFRRYNIRGGREAEKLAQELNDFLATSVTRTVTEGGK